MTATAAEMLDRLRRHYIKPGPMPGGIFLPECGLNGATARRVDALYVGFTSTSGRHLVGHEIKVSRSDWLHELNQPGKADLWADQCHAWYAVAPSTDIIKPEELPAGWGLMVINPKTKTRLDVKRRATVHVERQPSWQIVRSIMARLDTLQAAEIHRVRSSAEQDAREKLTAEITKRESDRAAARSNDATGILAKFEEELGLSLHSWMLERDKTRVTPEALKSALALLAARERLTDRYGGLEHVAKDLRDTADRLLALELAAAELDATKAS